MKELMSTVRSALTLNTQAFANWKASPDVFRRGVSVVLVLGLLVGLVAGLVGIARDLTSNPAQEIAQAGQSFEQTMKQFMPQGTTQFMDNYSMGFRIAERIAREAKTPLPQPVSVIFKQIGVIFSYPLGWLGSLIFYGALVQICAKLLGGSGTIAQMLGLSSLTVVPHILDIVSVLLGVIPQVGSCAAALFGLVVLVWSVAVYIKGTAVAHDLSGGRAAVAVFLPILVAFFLALLALIVFGLLIAVAASGGR